MSRIILASILFASIVLAVTAEYGHEYHKCPHHIIHKHKTVKVPYAVVKKVPEVKVIKVPYKVPVKVPVYIPIKEEKYEHKYEHKEHYGEHKDMGHYGGHDEYKKKA
ncbi:hypothetical protein RDWZM_009315 [Blomia tropicalis]|uniref:Uncharacterized protein n=1 Tax=Blomia tropicalis TaxID=40697 RepID=A0A9Q0M3W1_BLOTA|nr:hypothetical protein BLOT_005104 [Blomia tropicalis]KAJ6218158.1 hypothetical protein RDWZM_009315 [Blomia tropicalis]